jgi:hypothetical protein
VCDRRVEDSISYRVEVRYLDHLLEWVRLVDVSRI